MPTALLLRSALWGTPAVPKSSINPSFVHWPRGKKRDSKQKDLPAFAATTNDIKAIVGTPLGIYN
jgi:hypothetical protein